MKYAYLLINLFTIIGPLAGSFERRVDFRSKWKYAVPAIFITAIPFLIWDALFTKRGVWGFNPEYYLGYDVIGLPVEEWLFFFTVPFACLLIYETVCYLRPMHSASRLAWNISTTLGIGLLLTAMFFHHQLYTLVAFSLAGALLIAHGLVLKRAYLSNFFIAYLISWIPFLIMNGFLTALPVVWYNDHENLGVRIGTIPLEDSVYSLLLLLANVTVYEKLMGRKV